MQANHTKRTGAHRKKNVDGTKQSDRAANNTRSPHSQMFSQVGSSGAHYILKPRCVQEHADHDGGADHG